MTTGGAELPILWSHVPAIASVSESQTSNVPQHDVGSYLDLHTIMPIGLRLCSAGAPCGGYCSLFWGTAQNLLHAIPGFLAGFCMTCTLSSSFGALAL